MIIAAAIRYKGVVYHLPAPARHHHVLHDICEKLGLDHMDENEQGFLNDKQQFLNRFDAYKEAENCDQFQQSKLDSRSIPGMLFSEDLW